MAIYAVNAITLAPSESYIDVLVSEFQDTPFHGSNCNITVDDVSPNGFWVWWS